MDTKTWIAVAAGFASVGLVPAFATDEAQKESIEMRASEKGAEKEKNDVSRDADARTEKAREKNAQERDSDEENKRHRRVNPNAI